ncbi:hypothetical protein ACFSQ0_02330 [Mesonia sediminis]|uniref:TonB C-terminal domain-containing protein n=2 Tax=Mesonia TaxID=232115 RepID=A0ABW5SDQ0_9FLAO
MRVIVAILCLVLLGSCSFFEKQKMNPNDLVEEELKQIDWHQVEQYPVFKSCAHCDGLQAQQRCFETTLTKWVIEELSKQHALVTDSIHEQLVVYFKITRKGEIFVDSLKQNIGLAHQLPELKQWLTESIENLPEVYPAQKRGVPVQTTFQLPVQIISE